jgi:ABC-type hemin transport system ATPase subunit
VLILDEPLASLDWKHQQHLLVLLGKLVNQGLTVVDATHQFLLMPSHDDQVLVLSPRGEALAIGKPSLTITPELIQNAFELDERSTFRARLRF